MGGSAGFTTMIFLKEGEGYLGIGTLLMNVLT